MSKKYILTFALLLIVANIANAQSTTTRAQVREEARQEIGDIKQEAQGQINEVRTTARNQIEERKEETMRVVFSLQTRKVNSRLGATIERLENIASRVSSRIEKIKNAGGDTVEAEKSLAQARESIANAKAELIKLQTSSQVAENSVSSTTPMSKDIKKLRDSAKIVQKYIVSAHKSLEQAVGNLKGRSSTTPNATSTNN